MQRWLERDGMERLMVAASTLADFKRQQLPDHVRVNVKKRRGRCINDARGRMYRNTKLIVGRWPEDQQIAIAAPSLLCVLSGQPTVHIADYTVVCWPGDILFFPAGAPRPDDSRTKGTIPPNTEPANVLWLGPQMSAGDGMECSISHWFGNVFQPGQTNDGEWCWLKNRVIANQFEFLSEELKNSNTREVAYHLLLSIFLMLQREIEQEYVYIPHQFSASSEGMSTPNHDPIEVACTYIQSNIRYPLTIDIVSSKAYLSPASFTRKFRERTGQTFKEYVTSLRMKEAASLLQNTEWSVDRVARFVGLRSSRLRELFHAHHGCSPRQFRERKDSNKIESKSACR